MKTRRSVGLCVAVCLLTTVCAPRVPAHAAAAAKSAKPVPEWTPDRVRAFILNVERELEKLSAILYASDWQDRKQPFAGRCYGDSAWLLVEASRIMPKMRTMITGQILPCYVATYFGCTVGGWIALAGNSIGPDTRPFTLSRVTIIEQTPDRVVADVVEAPTEEVFSGVARADEEGHDRVYTEAEVAVYTQTSRYTITRGADGIWRISDRKAPFKMECRPN